MTKCKIISREHTGQERRSSSTIPLHHSRFSTSILFLGHLRVQPHGRRTERLTPDKVSPMCRYALQATQKVDSQRHTTLKFMKSYVLLDKQYWIQRGKTTWYLKVKGCISIEKIHKLSGSRMSAPAGCMFSSYTTKIFNIINKFNQRVLYSLAGQGSIFSRLFTSNIFLDFASMPWSVFLEITETVPGIRNERLYAPVSSGFFKY